MGRQIGRRLKVHRKLPFKISYVDRKEDYDVVRQTRPRRASAGLSRARMVAERFPDHGLELGVAECAFLSEVFAGVLQFLGNYRCPQARLIGKSAPGRDRIQGQLSRMRSDQVVRLQSHVDVRAMPRSWRAL